MNRLYYIPSAYAALIYCIIVLTGLLLSLLVGLRLHAHDLLQTHCNNWEFLPSISTATGDGVPERQIWRAAFILCTPFRLGASMALFSVLWQHASHGLSEMKRARQTSIFAMLRSTAFLTAVMLFAELFRLISAVGWTLISSQENLQRHNIGFGTYMLTGLVCQITLVIIVRRNTHNPLIYSTPRRGLLSVQLKKIGLVGQTLCAFGVVLFYIRHLATCADGSFSLGNMCEWTFAAFNVFFDGTSWFDLELDGWWFGLNPEIMKRIYAHAQTASVSQTPKDNDTPSDRSISDTLEFAGNNARTLQSPPYQSTTDSHDPTSVTAYNQGRSGANVDSPTSLLVRGGHHKIGTGEQFLGSDVILHRFTFCSAPSKITMWVIDTYWGYLLFTMMIHLVQHMYFMPLVKMSISYDLLTTFFSASPLLLRIPVFRSVLLGPAPFARSLLRPSHPLKNGPNRVVPMYILFYFLAALSHFHFNVTTDETAKLVATSFGPFFLSMATFIRYLYPTTAPTTSSVYEEDPEESRRMIYAIPIGFILSMLLRILHISQDPLYTDALYNGLYGIVLGIGATTIIYRHTMFSPCSISTSQTGATKVVEVPETAGATRSENDGANYSDNRVDVAFSPEAARATRVTNTYVKVATSYSMPSGVFLAVLFGSFCGASTFYFSCANVIPRMLAITPYPASLMVVAAFTFGVYYSADIIPLYALPADAKRGYVGRSASLRSVGTYLNMLFRGSWVRFGILYFGSALTLFFATRQTNRSYELSNPFYPVTETSKAENVLLKYWAVEQDFFGNKYVAFAGGLVMSACFGALSPVVMEITFVHQRLRRLLRPSDGAGCSFKESSILTSFELYWFLVFLGFGVAHALTTSYPFAPGGWIFRERPVFFQLLNLALVFFPAYIVSRKIRANALKPTRFSAGNTANSVETPTSKAPGERENYFTPANEKNASAGSDTDEAANHAGAPQMRKQRTMQGMMIFLILYAFTVAVLGRAASGPGDASVPEGKMTAALYPAEVGAVHEALATLNRQRNGLDKPNQEGYATTYYDNLYETQIEKLREKVLSGDATYNKFGLASLPEGTRNDIWEAARGMTFFSGMIWTVHFALDNYNVDDLDRMVEQIRRTQAGVVGLLESDSMHFVNGNRDMVEYVSWYMGYRYTDYGPTALDSTYGCALISKYPITWVRRYVMPSPLGELACLVHAKLDVYGISVNTYVGHFGNTQHWADGLLQSQFLGKVVRESPGPSMFLGYVVSNVGNPSRYLQYSSPTERGLLRDAGLDLYINRDWRRLTQYGGYDEVPPTPPPSKPFGENEDHDVEWKIAPLRQYETKLAHVDESFRRVPEGQAPRYFYYNDTRRLATAHPRYEAADRYCQYSFYKTGAARDELPEYAESEQPMQAYLYDWFRVIEEVRTLSDTEIQVIKLGFKPTGKKRAPGNARASG